MEIPDSNLANDYTGDPSIYEIDPHLDGIDIYLYPQIPAGEPQGWSSSQCISNGSALLIAGNFPNLPHIPFYLTSVISHEMGHCLGLFHTNECTGGGGHAGCASENVARTGGNANCSTAGDYLCDTPADHDMKFSVDAETCTWDSIVHDPFGYLFNPDETNIMGRTNPVCMQGFSPGQRKMMRKFIKFQDDVKLNRYYFDIDEEEINANTSWTTSSLPNEGEVTVQKSITINPGKTLTIANGVIIHFWDDAKIIIEPGGRLNLNGKLTSFCGKGWKGIEVRGESDQSQYVISGHIYQGQVFTSGTAVIENAETAILASGPDVVNETGGIVICNGTTFRNNSHSVVFPSYQNTYPGGSGNVLKDNVSFFSNCVFEVNDSVPLPFRDFAKLSGVDGIKFEKCTFKNEMTGEQTQWRHYGVGIRAADATFHVNRVCRPDVSACSDGDQCLFQGLAYGIYDAGILGNKPFSVKNAEFRNCYMGIYQTQVDGATIIVNRFTLGTVPDESLMAEQFGIYIEGQTLGMDLQENTFTQSSGSADQVFGIYSQHLGAFNNVIRKNTFSGLDYANVAEGFNGKEDKGLYFECNSNLHGTEFDFSVMEDPNFQNPEGIRPIQGITSATTGANLNGAGNIFYHNSNIHESDFFNDANFTMKYLYGPSTNREPLYFDTTVVKKFGTNDNQCVQNYCVEQCKTGAQLTTISSNYNSTYTTYSGLLSSLYNSNGSINTTVQAKLTALKAIMDEDVRLEIQHIMYDTTSRDLSNLRSWLAKGLIYEADILKANSYAADRSWSNALSHLSSLTSTYHLSGTSLAEHNRYTAVITLLKNVYNNGGSVDVLNSPELFTLDSLRDLSFGLAKRTADNILMLYDSVSSLTFHVPGGSVQQRSAINNPLNIIDSQSVYVRPNPASEDITIDYNIQEQDQARFMLYDLNGQKVRDISLDAEFHSVKIELKDLPKGIYLYEVFTLSGKLQTGKIVLQ